MVFLPSSQFFFVTSSSFQRSDERLSRQARGKAAVWHEAVSRCDPRRMCRARRSAEKTTRDSCRWHEREGRSLRDDRGVPQVWRPEGLQIHIAPSRQDQREVLCRWETCRRCDSRTRGGQGLPRRFRHELTTHFLRGVDGRCVYRLFRDEVRLCRSRDGAWRSA